MDEETFLTAFEDVPSVKLFSAKDLEEQMKFISETIGDDKKDWKQRSDAVSFFSYQTPLQLKLKLILIELN